MEFAKQSEQMLFPRVVGTQSLTSVSGQRRRNFFVYTVTTEFFCHFFNKPCIPMVAAITNVAFSTMTEIGKKKCDKIYREGKKKAAANR